ncbi:hypothetical protein NDU88_004704 [Pleurodeles waltl]|uniref:Uncharacterized protein n=1 Tax=Pleurodeles waltl TaxID=8319 RepID=A0AAV7UG42_PLEWA|nr:hypothetical protein NDU88_004704 [Pleurodeles waltl]
MATPRPAETPGAEPEDTPLGNPDIQIPVAQKTAGRPWRGEDAEEQRREDGEDTEEQRREDDVGRERKTESGNAETRE